jgi:hypothetical protein
MALAAGTRLGAYEIVDLVGEDGMGQVYRARDAKLNREVAIKILPDAFASDADRVARFTREAQTLDTLNHPHIAQIYGLEHSSTTTALVMELVEGEDLAQRIATSGDRKPIPLVITPADEAAAVFSPDGKWIAYGSDESGRREIYVRDFAPDRVPSTGSGKWQISIAGGDKPRWSHDGKHIYYRFLPVRRHAGRPVPDQHGSGSCNAAVAADHGGAELGRRAQRPRREPLT